MLSKQFSKFLFFGGLAAAVNFVSRIFYSQSVSYRWAVFLAYLTGMITAFLLQKRYVFERSGKHPANELFYFTIINILAVAQVWLISIGLAEYFFPYIGFDIFAEEAAHAIGISIPVLTSYYGHKYLSFKKIDDTPYN